MEYRIVKDDSKIVLKSTMVDLDVRWILRAPTYFKKNEVGNNISAFTKYRPNDRRMQRTSLALCEDDYLERTVLVKTVKYEASDLDSSTAVDVKRSILKAQVDILNAISSNMLPEPLDLLGVNNQSDAFDFENAAEYKKNEPVLILDYIPGDILGNKLLYNSDKTFYRTDDKSKSFSKDTSNLNVAMVMRLAGDILCFMEDLYDKRYAYTALSVDHIVLLGDNKPRFVGIGRICPVKNDCFDVNHINYGRFLKGYSAPEFNSSSTMFGYGASVKAGLIFNLGVLISRIVLGKSSFDEKTIVGGAYSYQTAEDERNQVKAASHGAELDSLIYNMTQLDPGRRLTDFDEILQEFQIISGDAKRESKKETMYYGSVKFFAKDKGFGFVTSGGVDYWVPLSRLDSDSSTPSGYDGQPVSFTIEKDRRSDRMIVKNFVTPPRTDVKFPVKPIKKVTPPPAPRPVPQPTPAPKPTPKPQPTTPPSDTGKKKGLFARLFGL